jgi:hypothetical protein
VDWFSDSPLKMVEVLMLALVEVALLLDDALLLELLEEALLLELLEMVDVLMLALEDALVLELLSDSLVFELLSDSLVSDVLLSDSVVGVSLDADSVLEDSLVFEVSLVADDSLVSELSEVALEPVELVLVSVDELTIKVMSFLFSEEDSMVSEELAAEVLSVEDDVVDVEDRMAPDMNPELVVEEDEEEVVVVEEEDVEL